jgi:hypothetical protein
VPQASTTTLALWQAWAIWVVSVESGAPLVGLMSAKASMRRGGGGALVDLDEV